MECCSGVGGGEAGADGVHSVSASIQPVRFWAEGSVSARSTKLRESVRKGVGLGRLGKMVWCGKIEWSVEVVGEAVEREVRPAWRWVRIDHV